MKSEKGQSLVEFAFVIPMLVLLLFGIVDFGRAFHAYLVIDHAGREAARAASLSDSNPTQVAVQSGGSIGLATGHVNVNPGSGPGTDATVVIKYPFEFITPIASGFTITNTTVMRVE
ncbi:TadE family protein [Bacillus sp. B15-48]|uniref:TadE/TadG family type IV pilus assembly protein n=1 Tax=Bacillus sp. B15-48 TaxID=1548601 RepID=UPI00193F6AF7|nr:TadE family protein [Bacillus sp. B15-48]MBM4764492.1 hypothetical protein [Bacillus sp. B15-48]